MPPEHARCECDAAGTREHGQPANERGAQFDDGSVAEPEEKRSDSEEVCIPERKLDEAVGELDADHGDREPERRAPLTRLRPRDPEQPARKTRRDRERADKSGFHEQLHHEVVSLPLVRAELRVQSGRMGDEIGPSELAEPDS